jgi:hypothetical protein
MGGFRNLRRQELAQLQLQLESAGRLRDEIEKRPQHKRTRGASKSGAIDKLWNSTPENNETRFAAFVAFGMSKIRSG